jgi:hypothetical protein
MKLKKYQTRTKEKIQVNLLSFFKTQDVKHLVTHKLKEIKQIPGFSQGIQQEIQRFT